MSLFAPLTLAFAPSSSTFGYTLDASRNISKSLGPNDQTDCPAGSGKPCSPGNEVCGPAFTNAPRYHLMSQNGCAEASRAILCKFCAAPRMRLRNALDAAAAAAERSERSGL